MNKLYNPETKEIFLATYENKQTQNTIRYVFYKTELIEDVLGKDLFSFNQEEIGKAIKNSDPHNVTTAKTTGRFISNYISWAIEERLRKTKLNPLKGTDDSWYETLVDQTKKIHYSKEEFIDLLEKLPNAQDQAFLMLMFEGVIGRAFEEIRNIHYNDINWNMNEIIIRERDSMVIKVDDICMRYLQNAKDALTYRIFNPDTHEYSEKELFQGDYIFRNVKSPRGREGDLVKPSVFYTRLNNVKNEFDLLYLTPNGCKQSGAIYMAAQLIEEKLDEGKERTLEYEDFEKIGEKYNYSKIVTNGHDYYNTTLMKEFINQNNLKQFYNLDTEL